MDIEQRTRTAEKLKKRIEASVSPFHSIIYAIDELEEVGFEKLELGSRWKIERGRRYYVNVYGSTLVAFTIGEKWCGENLKFAAAHSDFPCLKIKPSCQMEANGYIKMNVEVYGGAILNTWLDRPLSAAGRVVLKTDDVMEPEIRYIDLRKPLFIIPNLAIHMNRDANSGIKYNPQKDMIPLFGEISAKNKFEKIIAKEANTDTDSIISTDLFLYNREKGTVWGADNEFISAPRLDDVMCAYSCINALIKSKETNKESVNVCAVFDNEEVGSTTKQGADSSFLADVLSRISMCKGKDNEDFVRACASSFMLSADNAHAVHPNYKEKADPTNRPYMNKGIVIKYNANQKYTTDAVSAAIFKEICKKAEVPVQSYVNRSDIPGGSTLGNISNSHISLNTVDIGLAQLAMHSPYETAGIKDTELMIKAVKKFYETAIITGENGEISLK